MNNARLYNDVHGLRLGTEKILSQMTHNAMEQHYIEKALGNVGGNKLNNPKLKGHLSLDKPNGKFDSMDMKVHLTLKANKKQRSRSLSRTDDYRKENHTIKQPVETKSGCHSTGKRYPHQEHKSKRWSEILHNNEVGHKRKSRSRQASPPESHCGSARNRNDHEDNPQDHKSNLKTSDKEESNLLLNLNPVRTLHFLLSELKNEIQPHEGKKQHLLLSWAENIVCQMSDQPAPPSQQHVNLEVQDHASSRDQISRSTYEIMRKERDSLQKQLVEKTRSHIALERKYASLEAKLTRIRAERDEVRETSEKLVVEHRALLSHAQSSVTTRQVQPDMSNEREVRRLQQELSQSKEFIAHLQERSKHVEKQYHEKMKVVLDILHDGFDFTKNDSAHITDVVGDPPEPIPDSPVLVSKEDSLKLNLPNIDIKSDQLFSVPPFANSSKFNVEEFINDLMKKSGVLCDEQLSLFQSFQSIPELSCDK